MVQGGLIQQGADHVWNFIVIGGQIFGAIIGIWMVDKDKDGTPDIFQAEVKTTVTSASPIEITTEKKIDDT